MARYTLVLCAIALLARTWLPAERRRLIGRIGLRPGDTVLDHCTGPGGNLPAIAAAIGPCGKLVGMDLSKAMVHQARRFARRRQIKADIHQASAFQLPYANECFDALIHYGAINQFGDSKHQAMDEIIRVTKPGGTIVILDGGSSPATKMPGGLGCSSGETSYLPRARRLTCSLRAHTRRSNGRSMESFTTLSFASYEFGRSTAS